LEKNIAKNISNNLEKNIAKNISNNLEENFAKNNVDNLGEEGKRVKMTDEEMLKRKNLGQYFTTSQILQSKIVEFIHNNPSKILEPSTGRGDLIIPIMKKFPKCSFDLYEIDQTIPSNLKINYCNFLEENIFEKYLTIVGNPPFVRTKKGNLSIDFTKKCFSLLEANGELIFIIPSDFFKLTSTKELINNMLELGTFTHIFHPEESNFFSGANINILIFRYCKNPSLPKTCLYNNIPKKIINNDGTIIFVDNQNTKVKLFSDIFDIYVGLVSAKDEVFKNELGNIEVLVKKDKKEKFIYIKIFPSHNQQINDYLLENKTNLLERKIRKFNEDNWFEWGAPRNIEVMEKYVGKDCIYVTNLTRKEEVAFEGNVGYFGGNLIMMVPREYVNLGEVCDYINSMEFKKNYLYGGRFKIGHRQLNNAIL